MHLFLKIAPKLQARERTEQKIYSVKLLVNKLATKLRQVQSKQKKKGITFRQQFWL